MSQCAPRFESDLIKNNIRKFSSEFAGKLCQGKLKDCNSIISLDLALKQDIRGVKDESHRSDLIPRVASGNLLKNAEDVRLSEQTRY